MNWMEIVIKIPESTYKYLGELVDAGEEPLGYFERIIMRGTPLPKGHGRLIDADDLREDFKTSKKISFEERMDISCIVDHAQTIIEGSDSE